MPYGDRRQVRNANLQLGAVVADIEGLYAALLRTGSVGRRRRLLADLARAADRLAAVTSVPPEARTAAVTAPHSRWGRRRALAERGAAWIIARYGRNMR
jgi:hypothetical protein